MRRLVWISSGFNTAGQLLNRPPPSSIDISRIMRKFRKHHRTMSEISAERQRGERRDQTHNMSKVDTTQAASIAEARALPKSGREEGVGIEGNTVFFSRRPEDELREADGLVYLVKGISPVGAGFDVPPHWHPSESFDIIYNHHLMYHCRPI